MILAIESAHVKKRIQLVVVPDWRRSLVVLVDAHLASNPSILLLAEELLETGEGGLRNPDLVAISLHIVAHPLIDLDIDFGGGETVGE